MDFGGSIELWYPFGVALFKASFEVFVFFFGKQLLMCRYEQLELEHSTSDTGQGLEFGKPPVGLGLQEVFCKAF